MSKKRRSRREKKQTALEPDVVASTSPAVAVYPAKTPSASAKRRVSRKQEKSLFNLPWTVLEYLRIPTLPHRLESIVGASGWLWVLVLTIAPITYVGFALTVSVGTLGTPQNLYPWIDNDYWWHLATGNFIIDNREVPSTDPFLFTYGGDWVAHEWLGDLTTAGLDRIGGYQAGIIFTWVLAIAGAWALVLAARLYGLSWRGCCFFAALWLGVYLRNGVIMVRPQMWTFSFFALLFLAIAAHQTGRIKQIWFLIPLFLIWVNVNLTVIFGLFCLGAYVFHRMIRREADRPLIIGALLCLAMLLVNPSHIELISVIFKYRGTNEIWQEHIFEWMAPDLTSRINWPFVLAIPVAGLAIWQLLRLRIWPAVPLLLVLYQSFSAIRFTVIYALIVFIFAAWLVWQHEQDRGRQPVQPPISWQLPARLARINDDLGDTSRNVVLPALAIVIFNVALIAWSATYGHFSVFLIAIAVQVMIWMLRRRTISENADSIEQADALFPSHPAVLILPAVAAFASVLWIATSSEHTQFVNEPYAWGYPVEPANLILERAPNARIFNTYDYGGYLDHRFMGEPKIYIDGRGEMYSQDFFAEYFRWINGEEGWEEAFDEWRIDGIIVRQGRNGAGTTDGLAIALENHPNWDLIWADDFIVFYGRRMNPGDT